jgi:hypothetical protein
MRIKNYRRKGHLSGLFRKKDGSNTGFFNVFSKIAPKSNFVKERTSPIIKPVRQDNLFSKLQNTVSDIKEFAGNSGIINTNDIPQAQNQSSDNTMLYLGGAAVLALLLIKKK